MFVFYLADENIKDEKLCVFAKFYIYYLVWYYYGELVSIKSDLFITSMHGIDTESELKSEFYYIIFFHFNVSSMVFFSVAEQTTTQP